MSLRFAIGNRYGKLQAVKELGLKDGKRIALFRCDCGGQKTAIVRNVQQGRTRSCGCLKKEFTDSRRLQPGEAQLRYAFDRTRRAAEKRGYSFLLTVSEFRSIVSQHCHYCGSEPVFRKQKTYATGIALNGIDRKNNRLGYVHGNCVPCCGTCNTAKNDMTVPEFKAWIARVHWRMSE